MNKQHPYNAYFHDITSSVYDADYKRWDFEGFGGRTPTFLFCFTRPIRKNAKTTINFYHLGYLNSKGDIFIEDGEEDKYICNRNDKSTWGRITNIRYVNPVHIPIWE